jgi:diguanylate cyclase (GGDEF)-like protein
MFQHPRSEDAPALAHVYRFHKVPLEMTDELLVPALRQSSGREALSLATPELLREADGDLIARLARGILPYLILLLIIVATTDYRSEHPLLFWSFTAAFVASIGTRIALIILRERVHGLRPRFRNAAFVVAVGLPAAAAGLVHASALWFYGFESWPYVITMMWIVGCASGSTISLTPNFQLLRIYLWTAWTPVFSVVLWLGGKQGYTVALTTAALVAFLLMQGHSLHNAYWRQLWDRALESARTRELEEARMTAETSARFAQQAERLELDRKNVLELVAKDQPLDQIALAMARAVSRHLPLSACSIQMELQGSQRISVSSLVPEQIACALARIPIASVRETVYAASVDKLSGDPDWQQFVEGSGDLAQRNYLATSILQNRLVVGMIVTLLLGEKLATAADGELLESWARFASLAIERRGFYEQLSFRAQYDELTMLLNRASLYDRIDAQITGASPESGSMAILYFDLDSFKEINDRYGHAAGDAVLRMVSRRVLQSIRRADVAARVGGDEFVVLLPGVRHRSDASRVGELIGQAVSEPIEFEGRELHVGPSIGVAIYPDDGRVTDALLKFADEEMYKAKLSRRSQPLRSVVRPLETPKRIELCEEP